MNDRLKFLRHTDFLIFWANFEEKTDWSIYITEHALVKVEVDGDKIGKIWYEDIANDLRLFYLP